MGKSEWEKGLSFQMTAVGLEPEREYMFAKDIGRRWRADFAFPEKKVLIEVEGGVWVRGRHNRGQGFINDCEKYNAAAEMGWTVLRYPPEFIESGEALEQIERVLDE